MIDKHITASIAEVNNTMLLIGRVGQRYGAEFEITEYPDVWEVICRERLKHSLFLHFTHAQIVALHQWLSARIDKKTSWPRDGICADCRMPIQWQQTGYDEAEAFEPDPDEPEGGWQYHQCNARSET